MGHRPRIIWQEHFGPIPDNMKLIHINGNVTDNRLENLALSPRSNRSGYVRITVEGKRVKKHRWVWEQHNGPIPEGFVIHHKDGNIFNNDITNLELLPDGKHRSHHNNESKSLLSEAGRKGGLKRRKVGPGGTSWCWSCQRFLTVESFTKARHTWNGLDQLCRECKRRRKKP